MKTKNHPLKSSVITFLVVLKVENLDKVFQISFYKYHGMTQKLTLGQSCGQSDPANT